MRLQEGGGGGVSESALRKIVHKSNRCGVRLDGTEAKKFADWNVRGLNDPSKRFVVRDESKVNHVSGSFLRSLAGSFLDKCVFLESNGASDGLITCWSSQVFSCKEVIVRNYSISILLEMVNCGTRFFLTNVYGLATWDGKEDFFSELALLKDCCKGKWVMCGDFNCTREPYERNGKAWSSRATVLFNNLIRDLELIDLPMTNQSFTWSNLQKPPTLARLDRLLVSTDWDLDFPISKVAGLPRVALDHNKREELKTKLAEVLKDEEALWKSRAKQHWLREGDSNTKFFHAVANGRRRVNRIDTLDEDGRVYQSEGEKQNLLFLKHPNGSLSELRLYGGIFFGESKSIQKI
ncbi:hypothetical protein ACMD2_18612 [Ananas comosus]|uniref:Endonuclease/exonuclease/phosphatase domain-containing protein n=1 Tax=Ananas comosus TaxID=4615 RepID=A0A199VCG2_ANACO|nr:hypothetical protein ACMD2_18612 [Ananas comosus]